MRAVKADKHAQFADDHQLYSYFVSAKSGDHVQQAFYRVAADLAGIVLTKNEIDQKAVSIRINNQLSTLSLRIAFLGCL